MAEYLDQFSKGFADLMPYERIMIRHLERGIGRETSFPRLGCAAKHHHSYRLIHARASRRRSRNDVSYRTNEPFPVVPQGAEIEFVFATEAGINARLFDTQLLRQHIHGCATVPVVPKHGQRAIQGDLLLNFSRHHCTRQKRIVQPTLVVTAIATSCYRPCTPLSWRSTFRAQLIIYPKSGHGALFQYSTLFVQHTRMFLNG